MTLCMHWCLSALIGELCSQDGPQLGAAFVNLMIITGFLLSCVKEKQVQYTLKCREPVGFLKLIKRLVQLHGLFYPNRNVKKQNSAEFFWLVE